MPPEPPREPPPRVAELRIHSEGLAQVILEEIRIPQVCQILFDYCRRSRLDPEFLAIGLQSLGCFLITLSGNSICSFTLDGNFHQVVWNGDYQKLTCREMVYYKNWTAGATTLNDQSLNVTEIEFPVTVIKEQPKDCKPIARNSGSNLERLQYSNKS